MEYITMRPSGAPNAATGPSATKAKFAFSIIPSVVRTNMIDGTVKEVTRKTYETTLERAQKAFPALDFEYLLVPPSPGPPGKKKAKQELIHLNYTLDEIKTYLSFLDNSYRVSGIRESEEYGEDVLTKRNLAWFHREFPDKHYTGTVDSWGFHGIKITLKEIEFYTAMARFFQNNEMVNDLAHVMRAEHPDPYDFVENVYIPDWSKARWDGDVFHYEDVLTAPLVPAEPHRLHLAGDRFKFHGMKFIFDSNNTAFDVRKYGVKWTPRVATTPMTGEFALSEVRAGNRALLDDIEFTIQQGNDPREYTNMYFIFYMLDRFQPGKIALMMNYYHETMNQRAYETAHPGIRREREQELERRRDLAYALRNDDRVNARPIARGPLLDMLAEYTEQVNAWGELPVVDLESYVRARRAFHA